MKEYLSELIGTFGLVFCGTGIIGAALAILGCKGIKEKECCPLPSAFCKSTEKVNLPANVHSGGQSGEKSSKIAFS